MLTISLIVVGALTLFILGLFLWAYFVPHDDRYGISVALREGRYEAGRMLANGIDASARQRRLSEVRRKMDYAERLMELEEEIHGLRTRYAQRSPRGPQYSAVVQNTIDQLNAEIAQLKQDRS